MKPALTAIAFALSVATGAAATPNLGALRPTGGQRGAEVEVNLLGARLKDIQEVMFHQPGIKAVKLEVVNDNHVKARFQIAPDCRLGLHDLRVRTATGLSELRTFSVGALPETNEAEPNNEFAKPQTIAFNSVVNGVAENEDVDYFAIEVKKGERITAEVEGIRQGITFFDPYVAILDAKRFELSSSDDAALVRQDGLAQAIAPADGRYIIEVRESSYAGNGGCLYRLHVGSFPRARALVPAGGAPGESVAVKLIGDVSGDQSITLKLPAKPESDFGIQVQDSKGVSPYPNDFRLSPIANVIEAEPNNDPGKATAFTPPAALNGVVGQAGDADYFVFSAKKGQTFDARVFARQLRSPLDPVLYVAKRGQGAFAGSDDAVGPDSYIRFTIPDDGEYVVLIVDQLSKGGPDYFYRIELTPVAPKLTLSIPNEAPQRGTGVVACAIPRGNRQAILVNAGRADFGGELKLGIEGLPAGTVMECDAMAASVATMPVLITAKPDAPLGGSFAKILGTHADPKVSLAGEFSQTAELVLGQNNVIVWSRTVDALPVAVTEECPYSIEIVEPKVPLVRGGNMGLKVVAKRRPEFKGPISIYLPWNPPGVGSAGGIVIPENQNEAVIPMNADGGAELRTWKIVVNGQANIPGGPIMVSSQLASLAIAQQFVTLGFQAASVEQGKETDMAVAVNKAVDFPGEAAVTLIGLPNKVETPVMKITKDSKDILFHIKTDKASPVGNHQNLFCQVVITMNGEPIIHNLGTGQLRIDAPLPPKPSAPAAAPAVAQAPAAKPATAPAAPAKPLSRLEKLRLEQKSKNAGGAQK